MNEIRTVLVPVDLQHHSDTLAGYALHLAAKPKCAGGAFVHVRTEVEYLSVYDSSTFEAFEETGGRRRSACAPLANAGRPGVDWGPGAARGRGGRRHRRPCPTRPWT